MTTPKSGVIGLPEGIKEQGKRVDFKPDEFSLLIETKGYRLAWSRAVHCPCAPINDQTEQTDPNCPECEGSGWFYFKPSEPVTSVAGDLTPIQEKIVLENKAAVIKGIMTGVGNTFDPYNQVGNWQFGQTMVTVRPENKICYYDKIVNLDSTVVYYEQLKAGDPTVPLTTRYFPIGVNLLRSLTTEYVCDTDFTISDTGEIVWFASQAPAVGTKLAIHYLMHPTWLIIEHPHAMRNTLVSAKSRVLKTPQGNPVELPIQSKAVYEFLIERAS